MKTNKFQELFNPFHATSENQRFSDVLKVYRRGPVTWNGSIRKRDKVNLRIQSKCGKMRTRKTPNTDIFYAVWESSITTKKGVVNWTGNNAVGYLDGHYCFRKLQYLNSGSLWRNMSLLLSPTQKSLLVLSRITFLVLSKHQCTGLQLVNNWIKKREDFRYLLKNYRNSKLIRFRKG